MSITVSSIPWLEILEVKSAVKTKWVYFWAPWNEISVWQEMFLDSVVKLITYDRILTDNRDTFRILIETIIVYDGLSMRRMNSTDVRNKLRLKWQWKVSVKNRKDDTNGEISKELIELWLQVSGAGIAWPIYRAGKVLFKKWKWNEDKSDPNAFEATLVIKSTWEQIWSLKSVSEKWDSYVLQWDEGKFEIDNKYVDHMPVLRNISEINIKSLKGRELDVRINTPISWLNSDTAKGVRIIVETVISILDNTWKTLVTRHFWELQWKYRYQTLLESTPFWVSSQ